MRSWKRIALVAAMSVLAGSAYAMDAMPDDDLADTSGQSGLTISIGPNYEVDADNIRYYDQDGFSAAGITNANLNVGSSQTFTFANTSPGPCAGISNVACAAAFSTAGGTMNIHNFVLSNYFSGDVVTQIDVGSNSAGQSGLFIGSNLLQGVNLNLGGISFDNGDEVGGALGLGHAPTNAASYDSNGVLIGGTDIGGLYVQVMNASTVLGLITAGAPDIGTTSGLTITSLTPINLQMYVTYYNTAMQYFLGGELDANGSFNTTDGVIAIPVYITNLSLGSLEISAGTTPVNGYTPTTSNGLEVYSSGFYADSVDFGAEGQGDAGIQLSGSDAGSLAFVGLKVGPQHISITGH